MIFDLIKTMTSFYGKTKKYISVLIIYSIPSINQLSVSIILKIHFSLRNIVLHQTWISLNAININKRLEYFFDIFFFFLVLVNKINYDCTTLTNVLSQKQDCIEIYVALYHMQDT